MNFRRWITALAVLAVFAGLASAQTIIPGAVTCTVTAASAPALRAEGTRELVGDLLIRCSGGQMPAIPTNQVPAIDITVDYGKTITSRQASVGTPAKVYTDAILLIDDPASAATGTGVIPDFGNEAPINVCPTITAPGSSAPACATYSLTKTRFNVDYQVSATTSDPATAVNAANVYQGIRTGTNGTAVTFYGVPLVAPVTAGVYRQFRISNVRLAPGASQITASVTPSGPSTNLFQISGTTSAVVGTGQASLSTSLKSATGASNAAQLFSQCIRPDTVTNPPVVAPNVAILSFKEEIANAFKVRGDVVPATPRAYGTYDTESGVVLSANSLQNLGAVVLPGSADAATRLKAVFTGLPSNAIVYVSRNNVTDFATAGPAGTAATFTTGEATVKTDPAAGVLSAGFNGGANEVVRLAPTNGTVTAVWEVTASAASAETLSFAVYIAYDGTPTLTNASVAMSYAPISPAADAAVQIPQFTGAATAIPVLSVVPCQTSLLFPFVTNQVGFDTGIAISNTSSDPFGTQGSAGACQLNFYGANAGSAYTTASIASGSTWANTVSGADHVNFSGYVIAVCDFQFAHGFAYITSPGWGGPNGASMGYLATVLSNTTRGTFLRGEALGQ